MTALDESHLFPPPARLRRLDFWIALAAFLLLLVGLLVVALPDAVSGSVVLALSADHGLRQADVIGGAFLSFGSTLIWIMGLVWQCRHAR
jgi:anti-sigma factor RsiW